MPITGDCTSGRKRFLWVVSLKGKQQVSLRFLKKGVAASVSLLRRGGVLYMRVTLLVNLLRSTRRAGKVEHMSSALALVALTHLSYMHSELPFMLELASSPLVKLPCSPQRTIQTFGRLAGKWCLHELIGQRQRRQHFCTLQMVGWLRAVGVGSSSELAEAPQHLFSCTAVYMHC